MTHDAHVDARDLLCPLPVLKARKTLSGMAPGQVLRIEATDPMAAIDLPHFCAEAGHEVLETSDTEGARMWLIRRGPTP